MIIDLRRGVEREVEATPDLPNMQQRVADVLVDANIDPDGLPEGGWHASRHPPPKIGVRKGTPPARGVDGML
jgi:hypothetical protein